MAHHTSKVVSPSKLAASPAANDSKTAELSSLPVEKSLQNAPTESTSSKRKLSERLSVVDVADKPIPTNGDKQPTTEQQAILSEVANKYPVLVIEAGAGTGKTTTLRMIGDIMKGNGQYTAFNSSLVTESATKFKGTKVACNTTHSLGFKAVGRQYAHRLNGARVKSEVIAKLLGIKEYVVTLSPAAPGVEAVTKRLAPGFLAGQVLGAIKRFCQSAAPEVLPKHFRYIDGIEMPDANGNIGHGTNNKQLREYLLPFAVKAWQDLSNTQGQLPFNHDHYVKIWQLNNPVIPADYILLDEAQDTAEVMLDIIRQQTCPVILVGDSAQQIYEWRGAVNAMSAFGDAPTLLLSQSFRFGPAIAEVANVVLATLEQPTKLRLKGNPAIQDKITEIEKPTCILCCTNAVAVGNLLNAIADGRKPHLVGGGGDVIAWVQAAKDLQSGIQVTHPDLACFNDWTEVVEYSKMEEGEDLKLMVELIKKFGVDEILTGLQTMAKEEDADLVISTAHKSKGREWDHVQLAQDFPPRNKSFDADKKLLYVACTRAKLSLDVSRCPWFTGEELELIKNTAPRVEGIDPPTHVVVQAIPFTWSKYKDQWVVRGNKGQVGKTVCVVRKDGSKQDKLLRSVVWEDAKIALYQV